MTNFVGYTIFRLWLTTYRRGCVPGVPGGIDVPVCNEYLMHCVELRKP